MKYCIYGLNYLPEPTGIGKYSGEMAEWMVKQGHDVRVVAAPPYYPQWAVDKSYRNRYCVETLNDVKVYRTPLYVPENPTTVRRLIHLISFVIASLVPLTGLLFWRPKVVINVVPTLFTSVVAWLFSRVVGAKFVIHVQDFEGDAMFGLGMARHGFAARMWSSIERWILRRADVVSTISDAMISNAVAKGVDKNRVRFFPNWSEVERFQDVENVSAIKDRLGLPEGKKIVLYSGNIGRKQGLEIVLEAADSLKTDADILFVLCGEGSAKQGLVELMSDMNLNNVVFHTLQPYDDLPALLAMADVHLVVQNIGVADAVLPSKLTNILAVGGNAVITTAEHTEMGRLVERFHGIALAVEPESSEALAKGILVALDMESPNLVAKQYASQYLEKAQIISTFLDSLSDVAESKAEHGEAPTK